MRLILGNVWTHVVDMEADASDYLKEKLTIPVKGARGKNANAPMFCAFTTPPCFPTGWWRVIAEDAPRHGFTITVEDRRVVPCVPDWAQDISFLHERQLQAVIDLIDAKQGLIEASTGSGKTVMAVALMKLLRRAKWVFLVENRSLLDQTIAQWHRYTGQRAGKIGDGHYSVGNVTVAMYQTLYAKYDHKTCKFPPVVQEFLASRDGVIADEVHGAASERSTTVLRACRNAYYRYGLSATCTGRGDKRDAFIVSHFAPIAHVIEEREMTDLGRTALTEITMVRCVQRNINSWPGGYREAVSLSAQRNSQVVQIWRTEQRPILTFFWDIDYHGRYLAQLAQAEGMSYAVLQGNTPESERAAAVARMERGELDLLLGSNAVQQGVDMVHIRTLVNAAGMKAVIPTIQKKGRGTRVCLNAACVVCAKYGRKDKLRLFDFYDQDSAHTGKRMIDKSWIEKQSVERWRAYTKKGLAVKLV